MFQIHIWRRGSSPLERLAALERAVRIMAKTQEDLDAAIAGLPAALSEALMPAISQAVGTAIAPVIESLTIKNAGTPVDFSPEIDRLTALPQAVAAAVAPAIATSVANSLQQPAAGTGQTDTSNSGTVTG